MAFGDSFAAAAQKDFDLVTQKIRASETLEGSSPPPPVAVDALRMSTEEAPRKRSFSRAPSPEVLPTPPAQTNRFSRAPKDNGLGIEGGKSPVIPAATVGVVKSESPGVPLNVQPVKPVLKAVQAIELPAKKMALNRADGLDARLNRLIDVVADFRGLPPSEIKKDKAEALKNPDLITEKYEQIFKQHVLPSRNKVFQSIEEAQQANPDHVIFMHSKEGNSKLHSIPKEKAGPYAAYDGCAVEVISSGRSPFQPPSVLFAAPIPEQVVIDDQAFEEDSAAPERPSLPKP